MSLAPLVASFTLFALMEFGDKTHIAIITLSTKNRPRDIFLGSTAAFALVDGSSVVVSGAIAEHLPTYWLKVGSGILFLLLGVLSLIRKEGEREFKLSKGVILSVLGFVALMELGDKTQLASIVLAARYDSPLLVFLGIILAAIMITGTGVVLGQGLVKVIPQRHMKYISSALFIFFGALFLASALIGIEII